MITEFRSRTFLPQAVTALMTLASFLLPSTSLLAASQEAVRVAVVGEGEARELADVMLAELSSQNEAEVVERAQLEKLAGEKELQNLTGTDRSLALARIARAQAMIFVEKQQPASGPPAAFIRLVTVSDGVVRRTFWVPWLPQEVEANAKMAAEYLRGPVKQVRQSTAIPARKVSLLGIRGELNLPGMMDLESGLNALLAHRLSTLPGVVVLERWRMNDLAFDSLSGAQGFLPGSQLVQGALKVNGDAIKVRLSIKQSEADAGVVAEVDGQVQRLGELADALATQIAGLKSGALPPWQPGQEAGAYARLGAWLLEHALAYPAAQAFESAVALGDRSPESLVARTEAWAMCAYPEKRRVYFSSSYPYDAGKIVPAQLVSHLEAATRAAHYAADRIDQCKPVEKPQTADANDSATVGLHTFLSAAKALRGVRDNGRGAGFQSECESLRKALQRLVAAMDGTWMRLSPFFVEYKTGCAAYWASSPEETLAYYREVLSSDFAHSLEPDLQWSLNKYLRREISVGKKHAPLLDAPDSVLDPQVKRGLFNEAGTERLIDWSGGNPEVVRQKWRQFIHDLRSSASPRAQADGLGLEMGSLYQPGSQQKALEQMVALLWQHRALLTSRDGELMLAVFGEITPMRFGVKPGVTPPAILELKRLFQDLFEKETWVPQSWVLALRYFQDWPNLKGGELTGLLSSMDGYRKRTSANPLWQEFDRMRQNTQAEIFEQSRQQIQKWAVEDRVATASAAPASGEPLQVVRFWNPNTSAEGAVLKNGSIFSSGLTLAGDRLWLSHDKAGLVSVETGTLQTRVWGSPPAHPGYRGRFYEVLPGGKSLLAVDDQGIWSFTPEPVTWTRLPVPEARYRLHSLAEGPGFSFGAMRGGPPSGAGVGWMNGADVHWAFSTRRRPVEHPFDEAVVRDMRGSFRGPGGATWVAWWGGATGPPGVTAQPLVPNAAAALKFKFWLDIVPAGDRTLLMENMSPSGRLPRLVQAWCMRSDKDAPQLLVHDPELSKLSAETQAVWQLPERMRTGNSLGYPLWRPFLHGDELWILQVLKAEMTSFTATYLLTGFLPGRAEPVEIPLKFTLAPQDQSNLTASVPMTENPDCKERGFAVSSFGMAFSGFTCRGVWLLSWQEIEKFIVAKALK